MQKTITSHSVTSHFKDKHPDVKATYDAIVAAAKQLGTVKEEPKKTSIHLVRKSAFAGIATRKSSLVLTLKSQTDLNSFRISRRQQASQNRWYIEIRLDSPGAVDEEVRNWLRASFEISA